MTQCVKAICLKAVDYLDSDKMLLLFGAENGKFSARIRGVRKAEAKLKFCAQPFCFGEYEVTEKGGRYIVTNCTEIESFSSVSRDVDAYYSACAMTEFCSAVLQENQPNVELFIQLALALKYLTEKQPKLVLIKFLLEGLKSSGFGLTFDKCDSCGSETFSSLSLNLTDGGVACNDCIGTGAVYQLTAAEGSCLNMIDQTPYERLNVLKFENRYNGMLAALSAYVEHLIKRINSLNFLF